MHHIGIRLWGFPQSPMILGTLQLTAFVLAGSISWTAAAEVIYLGDKTAPTQSINSIEHSQWSSLLKKHVDQDGRVDYRNWKSNRSDVQRLDQYLKNLSSADPTRPATKQARLAFWINAYNAVTIRGILREYPTTSIRNHTSRFFGYNIWKHLQLHVGGRAYSLDQIEHEVLRKMGEPRIHFAIVCASNSCPRLLKEAYLGERVDQQLETNAKDFFRRDANFQFTSKRQTFRLSSILDWFAEDFGTDQQTRLARIAPWLPGEQARRAAYGNKVSIEYLPYDWNLNEQ